MVFIKILISVLMKILMKKKLKNTLWLENRYNFLKSFIKLIGEKDVTETVNNKVISSEIFKSFMNAIFNGIIDNSNIKEAYNKYFSDIEKSLAKSKSNKNVDQLKNYLIIIKNLVNKNDKKNYKVPIKIENMILTCFL